MKRLLPAALLTLPFLVAPSHLDARSYPAAKTFPVTITDDTGYKTHLARAPRRIVSLDPADTETLFALGEENRVVGDGSQYAEGATGISTDFRYPSQWPSRLGRDYPVRSKQLPHIEGGYGTTPFDLEGIEKLQPDVVFSLKSDLPTLTKLRSLGLKVIVVEPGNLTGVLKDIRLIGRATGASRQAARVVATMEREESSTRAALAHVAGRPRIFYEIDATNPSQPYTAGPGSFVDNAIRLARAVNVADTVRTCSGVSCYPQIDLESLVSYNPQIIVLADAAYGTTVAGVKGRTGWSSMAAVRNSRIAPINPDLLSRPGPRIMIGLRTLARLIHPAAFRR